MWSACNWRAAVPFFIFPTGWYGYARQNYLAWVKTEEFLIWCARMMTLQTEETLVTLVKFVRNRPTSIKEVMLTHFDIEQDFS